MRQVSKLILFVLAIGIFSVTAAVAQSVSPSSESSMAPYDLSKEIKVQGTIQKIETDGATGPIGTHILVQTSQGVVNAHLGFGSATTSANLGISDGASVTVIGMMQSRAGNSVLLARVLTTSSRVFVLRTERGIPVRAIPSGSFHTASTLKGDL